MRRTLAVLGLALPILAGWPRPASAIWNPPGFVVGGYQVGGDPNSLILLNDSGLDYVVSSDNPNATLSRQIAARMDSLRLSRPGFDLLDFVYEETGAPSTLVKNLDPLTNRSAIIAELNPASGLNNASVAGWFTWDEPPIYYPPNQPNADTIFTSILQMTRIVRDSTTGSSTHDKLAWVNLLPIQAYSLFLPPCSTDTVAAYLCYLDQYLAKFNADALPAPVLSFDKYPFESPAADFRLYFTQLALTRDKAAQYSRSNYRMPFWSVIQSAPRRENASSPYYPNPTFNQVRWQAYVSLAYGAKGIWYWTTRPIEWDPAQSSYGPAFLKLDGTANTPLYDSLTTLNAELKGLGPTLMKLDPVATYHASANRFVLPYGEDTLANPNKVYTIVSSLTGTNNEGMIGYFKARGGGDDYLLVVNKDTTLSQSFTVTLGNAADTVYWVNRLNGQLITVTTNATSFSTGTVRPGAGELFKIVDKIYEYIPNVNKVLVAGGRTYYAHEKGVVMVNYATGWRTYHQDGTVYTPVKDIAIGPAWVYIAQNNGVNGNIVRRSLDLYGPATLFFQDPAGGPGQPINSLHLTGSKLYVAEKILPGNTGRMVVVDTTGVTVGSRTFSTPVNRVRDILGAYLLVGHNTGVEKINDTPPYATANSWSDSPTKSVVALADDDIWYYAALDNGSSGKVVRLSRTLALLNTWQDGVKKPRCLDLSYNTGSIQLLVASSKTGDEKFTRLNYTLSTVLATRSATSPRACLLFADTLSFLATAAGVIKARGSNMAQQYRLIPARDDAPLDLRLIVANPMTGLGRVRLSLPITTRVRVQVFDVQGREMESLADGILEAGEHELHWNVSRVPRGIYLVRAMAGNRSLVRKVTVLHRP